MDKCSECKYYVVTTCDNYKRYCENFNMVIFNDEDCDKAAKVNSNTQLYKQAGNSIVVPVLEGIFKELVQAKIF